MKTFQESLDEGFQFISDDNQKETVTVMQSVGSTAKPGYYSFKFGDGYELCFEPLLWDNQYYVAIYKDQELLTEKVVVKPGKVNDQE